MIFGLWLVAVSSLIGCEQGGTVQGKVGAAHARNDAPPIWVVEDHDSRLYLFGTVHLLPSDLDWQRDDMKAAFDSAGTVFFEMSTDAAANLETSVLIQQLGFQESGKLLKERFDAYQLKLLDAVAHNGSISADRLNSMKPWLASEFVTIAAANQAGLSPELSADEALKSRATRKGKNVIYLDTAERQIRASADQPDSIQMGLLTETFERFNRLGHDLQNIADSWAVGDVRNLTSQTVTGLSERSPELYQTLIVERNQDWVQEFLKFIEGSDTGFAAVGVAHLLGPDSLQALLRDQGYTVSRYYAFQGERVIRSALPEQE